MKINIQAVQQAIQISEFENTNLLEIALTHPSRIYESYINRQQKYEQEREYRRLSILGDTILATTVIDYLHEKYNYFDQSRITDIKSNIVSRKNCYNFAKKLNLKNLCLLGGSEQHKDESQQTELFAEMFEALLGAVYLNYNRDFVLIKQWLVEHFIEEAVNESLQLHPITEEISTDYLQTSSSMDADDSYEFLWQMKEEVDALVAQDHKLQNLLTWIQAKSYRVSSNYQSMQVRAFYLALIRILGFGFVGNCDPNENNNAKAKQFFKSFNRVNNLALKIAFEQNSSCDPTNVIASVLLLDIEPEIKETMQHLKTNLPDLTTNPETFKKWRQVYGSAWLERIKRSIGYDLEFSKDQKEVIKIYYEKILFLINCVDASNLSSEEKDKIKAALILPV